MSEVEKTYETAGRSLSVLGPLSLEILDHEFLCVVGESGCGKSTLIRLLAGLEMPTQGAIRLNGEPILGPSHRRGVIFQKPALFPWMSVQENVAVGFKIRGQRVPTGVVESTIEMVGLKGFESSHPTNLSGGMYQRAAIARAVVSAPDVLLMDEPFSALDALTRLRMQREVLRIWHSKRLTIVFVTHDIDEAVTLATRILVMTPRPGRVGRIFQIPIEHPRSPLSDDILRLRGLISEELTDMLDSMNGSDVTHLKES